MSRDLLAVVLGAGIAGRPAPVIADALVLEAGGLTPLSLAPPGELVGVAGIGRARAARVVASFELGRRALRPSEQQHILGPADVFERLRPRVASLVVEVGIILALTAKNQVIAEIEIARGEATAIPVHPREVFRPLIRHGAVGGIFVHNHPSGDSTPSVEDIALTRRLVAVGEMVGIPLIDHVVIAGADYTSIANLLGTGYRP